MRSSDSNQKIQELMKDFFLVSSVSVLAIVPGTTGFAGFLRSPRKRAPLSKNLTLSLKCYVLGVVDGKVRRTSVSAEFGISAFLQPSVELEVAPFGVLPKTQSS